MNKFETLKQRIFADSDMDYVGICPSVVLETEPQGHRPSDLLPNVKSIIIFGRRMIDGSVQSMFRKIEDGKNIAAASYYAYSSVLAVNQLCMKEAYSISQELEKQYGCFAMPLTNNVLQAVQPEGNYAPFFADPYKAGLPIDIYKAAVAAGIGELAWNHRLVTEQDGPRVYICGILTSLEFEEYDSPYMGPALCNPSECHVCSNVCPVHALDEEIGEEHEIAGKKYKVGKLDVNGCSAACFGFKKWLNPLCFLTGAHIEEDHPDDETLKEALEKSFTLPGFQRLEHVPMYHCDRCLIYCPLGGWKEKYQDRQLTKWKEGIQ